MCVVLNDFHTNGLASGQQQPLNFMKYTQPYRDVANALREFERAHAVWMNTFVFGPEGAVAKQEKDRTMRIYTEAYDKWERSKRATIEECH